MNDTWENSTEARIVGRLVGPLPDCNMSDTSRSNDSNSSSSVDEESSLTYVCYCYDFVIEAVIMGALCLLGFIGNAVSTVCLSADRSKTATPLLLVSLEVADTLFLITVFALRVLTSVHTFAVPLPWLTSVFPYLGKYIYPCALISQTSTIYMTILVTLNRYISVCHPYKATNLCTMYYARMHIACVFIFSVVFNLPRFFEYDIVEIDLDGSVQLNVTSLLDNQVYKIVYSNILYCLTMFLVPLASLTFLNFKLIDALRQTKIRRAKLLRQKMASLKNSSFRTTSNPASHQTSGSQHTSGGAVHGPTMTSRSEDDITFMLVVVVMVFVITQTPALFTQLLTSSLSEESTNCPSFYFFYARLSDLLVVVNSSINFVIYCFCSVRFRQILLELVCRRPTTPSSSKASLQVSLVQGRPHTIVVPGQDTTQV